MKYHSGQYVVVNYDIPIQFRIAQIIACKPHGVICDFLIKSGLDENPIHFEEYGYIRPLQETDGLLYLIYG